MVGWFSVLSALPVNKHGLCILWELFFTDEQRLKASCCHTPNYPALCVPFSGNRWWVFLWGVQTVFVFVLFYTHFGCPPSFFILFGDFLPHFPVFPCPHCVSSCVVWSETCMRRSSAPLRTCSWMVRTLASCCSPGVVSASLDMSSSESANRLGGVGACQNQHSQLRKIDIDVMRQNRRKTFKTTSFLFHQIVCL